MVADFVLTQIPPAPRGMPQIEVTFDINASGVVGVSAVDKATGRQGKVEVRGDAGLSKEEVERMKRGVRSVLGGRREETQADHSAKPL